MITKRSYANMGNPISGGIVQNIVGFIAGYATALAVCMFMMDDGSDVLN